MTEILIIEDERRVAELLKRGLEESGYNATLAFDGEMGIRLLNSNTYDLIITDVILPGINGFELSKEIKSQYPDIPIIMLTALGSTDDKLEGFDSGIDDYMVKPFDFRELDARIKLHLSRKARVATDPAMLSKKTTDELVYGNLVMNIPKRIVSREHQLINLTPKEFNLLKYMLENPERVLTREEIAQNVWDTHFDTGTNFIDVYINYLRKKIDKSFDVKLIHTKPGVGFIFQEGNEDQD